MDNIVSVNTVEDAIRSWVRLDAAIAAVNSSLRADFGVTGAQLGMLRLVDEFGGAISLAELRGRLSLHPATLGQLIGRLADKALVELARDQADQRRRVVTLTRSGRRLLAEAPLIGPVRLRHQAPDPDTAAALERGFTAAITAFGLDDYVPRERNQQ